MISNNGVGPQFGETVYISEVYGTIKVKSNLQVAMNKNSDSVQKFFLRGGWEDTLSSQPPLTKKILHRVSVLVHSYLHVRFNLNSSNSNFSRLRELSETSRARNLILGLQFNIDKANSCGYYVTW